MNPNISVSSSSPAVYTIHALHPSTYILLYPNQQAVSPKLVIEYTRQTSLRVQSALLIWHIQRTAISRMLGF